jgi:Fic family protein
MRGSWPAIGHEIYSWTSSYAVGAAPRAGLARHRGPYRAAVPPSIAHQQVALSTETLAAADDAANEVSRFDAELGGEIAPFSVVLLRSESAASSQIENLTASARAISEAELGTGLQLNAAQVVGNVAAMSAALALSDRVTAQAILGMQAALVERTEPEIAGSWRTEQVWIGGSDLGPHEADFVPPHHRRVPRAVDDLIRFVEREDVPVLAHVALAHAQFETIHPFVDGNGRTGRALVHAMLRGKGLTRNVTVPLSAGLLVDTQRYFAALTAYRAGEPEDIVLRFVDAAFAAVSNGRRLVDDLRATRDGWQQRVHARRDAATWRVADLLLRHPVVNVGFVAEELQMAPQNVYRALAPLEHAGVLRPSPGHRDRVWYAVEVLDAVDAFAARAGRRSRPA